MAYKFKGYDYEELADCWGLTLPDYNDKPGDKEYDIVEIVEVRVKVIADYISEKVDWEKDCLDEKIRDDMLNFLFALENDEHVGTYGLMWGCLRKIADESDVVFVQMFNHNMMFMWS